MDIETLEVGGGQAVVRMQVHAGLLNTHGTCHGGYVFTLADTAFELACNSHGPPTVAAGAEIDFLAPVAAGTVLTATCEERWRQGRSGIYDVTVRDDAGEVVALFRGRSRTLRG